MFVLSPAMEIYGTWLGNWTWATSVPWIGLATVNPPLASGVFYCVLDLLVVATASRLSSSRLTSCPLWPLPEFMQFFPALRPAARL